MATFIFGDHTPARCAAAHRLLRDDRLYFKTAGRAPLAFSPRPADQVEELARQLAAQQKEEALWARFAADIAAAQQLPRPRKPSAASWEAGQHAAHVAVLVGYATGDASDRDKVKAIKALNVSPPVVGAHAWAGVGCEWVDKTLCGAWRRLPAQHLPAASGLQQALAGTGIFVC